MNEQEQQVQRGAEIVSTTRSLEESQQQVLHENPLDEVVAEQNQPTQVNNMNGEEDSIASDILAQFGVNNVNANNSTGSEESDSNSGNIGDNNKEEGQGEPVIIEPMETADIGITTVSEPVEYEEEELEEEESEDAEEAKMNEDNAKHLIEQDYEHKYGSIVESSHYLTLIVQLFDDRYTSKKWYGLARQVLYKFLGELKEGTGNESSMKTLYLFLLKEDKVNTFTFDMLIKILLGKRIKSKNVVSGFNFMKDRFIVSKTSILEPMILGRVVNGPYKKWKQLVPYANVKDYKYDDVYYMYTRYAEEKNGKFFSYRKGGYAGILGEKNSGFFHDLCAPKVECLHMWSEPIPAYTVGEGEQCPVQIRFIISAASDNSGETAAVRGIIIHTYDFDINKWTVLAIVSDLKTISFVNTSASIGITKAINGIGSKEDNRYTPMLAVNFDKVAPKFFKEYRDKYDELLSLGRMEINNESKVSSEGVQGTPTELC